MPGIYECTITGVDYYNYGKPGHVSFNDNKPDIRRNIHVNLLQVGYVFHRKMIIMSVAKLGFSLILVSRLDSETKEILP